MKLEFDQFLLNYAGTCIDEYTYFDVIRIQNRRYTGFSLMIFHILSENILLPFEIECRRRIRKLEKSRFGFI